MRYTSEKIAWKVKESLYLLQLVENFNEWPDRTLRLEQKFGSDHPKQFFTDESCKDEFDRILSSSHPEHFIRQKGEPYSQMELVKAWISYLQKEDTKETTREKELVLVKLREKANLFNRLLADDCEISSEEISRLLEEARLEDSKRDPQQVERQVSIGMRKLKELQALHESDPVKYPVLKISIPPSHPPDESGKSPVSPFKLLFDGIVRPPQLKFNSPPKQAHSVADGDVLDISQPSTSHECPVDIDADGARNVTYLETETSNIMTEAENRSPVGTIELRGVSPSGEETVTNELINSNTLIETNEKMGIDSAKCEDEVEPIPTAPAIEKVDQVQSPKKKRGSRKGRKKAVSVPQASYTQNNGPESAIEAHDSKICHQLSLSAQNITDVSGVSDLGESSSKIDPESNKNIRRSGRHSKEDVNTVTNIQVVKRKRRTRTDGEANVDEESEEIITKRRRLSSKEETQMKQSNEASKIGVHEKEPECSLEVQSSPEPEKMKGGDNNDISLTDEQVIPDARTRSRASKSISTDNKEKKSIQAISSPSVSPLKSPKGSTSPTKTTRRSRRGVVKNTDNEQKAMIDAAWRIASSHRHAAIFAHPVSDRDARAYSKTVKSRMDLSTLKKKTDAGEIRSIEEFKRNLLLMFANASMFNSTGHDVNVYAKEMAYDTLKSLQMLEKDVLYMRHIPHMTRSAAFAAEEARQERCKFSSSHETSVKSEDMMRDSQSELSSSDQKETPKTSGSRAKNTPQ